MSTGVDEQLRNELARIERPLAHAGFLIGEVRVVDEGSWGRLDAVVEGCNIAGKIQIHLGKKGRISIVPQGNAARAIAVVLEGTGGDVTAPNPSRSTPMQTSNTQSSSAQTSKKPPALARTADGLSKPKPATRRTSVRGNLASWSSIALSLEDHSSGQQSGAEFCFPAQVNGKMFFIVHSMNAGTIILVNFWRSSMRVSVSSAAI